MHHSDLIDRLDRPHHHATQAHDRFAALETWRTWANGEPINLNDLAAAVQTLNDPKLLAGAPGYGVLGDAITRWESDTGLQQQLIRQQSPSVALPGLDLGL